MELRPYQTQAIEAIRARYVARDRSTLLVLPTGCGKTVVFSDIVRQVAAKGGRSLIVAHREELIDQATKKLRAVAPDLRVDIEMAASHASANADAVVASIQTIARDARLAQWSPDHFRLIVIDEAHRALGATYRKMLEHFAPARVLGVTATPDRLDGGALAEVFDSVAFTYEIREAIAAGYLVPIRQYRAELDSIDLSGVRTKGGDLDEGQVESIIGAEVALREIAEALIERAGARPTVVFTPRVSSAHALADVLNARVGREVAAALDGGVDRDVRKATLARFDRGELQFLANCALFTEGWDAPQVACVAMARPTKSRALYAQCVGRGTRPAPAKADLLVIDFAGNAGRHRLVNPIDILGGDGMPEGVRKRAEELLDEDPSLSTDEALARAEAEENDAAVRRARRIESARFRFQLVDPFSVLDLDLDAASSADEDPASSSTARAYVCEQLARRHKVKSKFFDQLTLAEAREMLRALDDRRRRGLCTWNQARTLARYGLRTDISFEAAKVAMTALAAGGWKRAPRDLLVDPAFGKVARTAEMNGEVLDDSQVLARVHEVTRRKPEANATR